MFLRTPLLVLLLAAPLIALGYADEDRDWGVAAGRDIRRAPYSAPTPMEVPGARVIGTDELKALLSSTPAAVLADVAAGEAHVSLPGAVWLPNAGRGINYLDTVQAELAEQLAKLTGGEKSLPVVFFCVNSQCWLSYNASLRAAALGYANVHWYRGGIDAWRAAGLPLARLGPSPR
jgi:PQQ-dependent catabolism-associated CXXCW motif protein